MAFDYGTKRIGIAVSDPLKMIANAMDTIHPKDIVEYLKKYLKQNEVETFVVGEPKRMDNTASDVEENIIQFMNLLKKHFPKIGLERMDERFTSKIAFNTMLQGGLKKKDRANKETLDKVSASIILQDYLEQLKFRKV